MSHPHEPGSYYVPEYSWLPILSAIGLFIIGLGSIEYFEGGTLGIVLLASGAGLLVIVLAAWFGAVMRESRQGLYDAQMHRTFRWGMGWFIFTDAMLFVGLLGAVGYCRLFTLPQLAGSPHAFEALTHYILWPHFQAGWPLLRNPDPLQFIAPEQGLASGWRNIITTLVMLGSGLTLVLANLGFKTQRSGLLNTGFMATLGLIALFLILKLNAVIGAVLHFGVTLSSGIYGSLVMMVYTIFLLHILTAALWLSVIIVRGWLGHLAVQNDFSIRAFSWFWYFLIIVWLAIFFSFY